ncbi:MAG: hypothetical protein IT258_19675 [Saprospiraceae bacterium]|nr:hypothetical protein [Saprospiraceae bacterium]
MKLHHPLQKPYRSSQGLVGWCLGLQELHFLDSAESILATTAQRGHNYCQQSIHILIIIQRFLMKHYSNLIICLILLLVTVSCFGQNLDTWQSQSLQKDKDANSYQTHFFSDGSGHYTNQYVDAPNNKSGIRINHFSPDFKLLESKDYFADKNQLITVIKLGNHFAWVVYEFHGRNRLIKALPIKPNGTIGNEIILMEFQTIQPIPFPRIEWAVSPDSTKLMVAYTYGTINKEVKNGDEPQAFYLATIDKDYKLLWNQHIVLPSTERSTYVTSWAVSNDGVAFMTARTYDKEEKKKYNKYLSDKAPAGTARLYRIVGNSEKPIETTLVVEGKKLRGSMIQSKKNGKLECIGFYSDKDDSIDEGIACLTIDPKTCSIESTNFFKLDNIAAPKNIDKDIDPFNGTYFFRDAVELPSGNTIYFAQTFSGGFQSVHDADGTPPIKNTTASARSFEGGGGSALIIEVDNTGKIVRKALFPSYMKDEYTDDKANNNVLYLGADDTDNDNLEYLIRDNKVYLLYYIKLPSLKSKFGGAFEKKLATVGIFDQKGDVIIKPIPSLAKKEDDGSLHAPILTISQSSTFMILQKADEGKNYHFNLYYIKD